MTAPSSTSAARFGSHAGTVITVAPTGAHAKSEVAGLPVSAEEVAGAAADCERVGAAVLDLQPRHDTALPDVVAAVHARTGLIVRVAAYARSEALETLLDSGADVLTCPLDAPGDFVADLRAGARTRGLEVHYEARDLSHLATLRHLQGEDPVHAVLIFGGSNGMPGDIGTLSAALAELPQGATFSATGVGETSLPIMLATIAAGGHVRVGMADTLAYSDGVEVRDNTQLAARAAGVAKIAQRPPLPPAQAREALGLT
ncbi:uncharacterized protein (DUF849 family) [Halopolyspora algeriensis]|uniref:Uncharacterized protein (DUF849 family) n=1 Tax=Halopolyspora algeriensis TaxID=1500506 RepID=A0A368VXX1_9ACTN|nr:3-keto-5-aminohexanoate cleavage protein [Halopolyspora algeriensis]RCW47048.1 uncharacterized protein (DUF849 family) [Halopolyspora algeriensis]TQM48135.1 uncharacterized protein (DUF849 family) [Halopolyspora algeriensis]